MTKLFGRTYTSVGDSNSDFIIKTRGQVKIQWGKKFIDLIKNGKINTDGLDDIFTVVDSIDDIGNTNGLYYVNEDGSLWIVIGGQRINLKGDIGTTYVSFIGQQETDGEQKHTALTNIGFLFPSLEEAQSANLTSGIIYVENTQKLYIVLDGQLSEYTFEIPNPYPKQFVISKDDTSRGALVIQGDGEQNGLIVGDIIIYSDDTGTHLNSEQGALILERNGDDYIVIEDSITMNKQVIFKSDAVSQMFKSQDANEDSGFRLYMQNGESTLEVDNLIVRNQSGDVKILYPTYWSSENNNIIADASTYANPDNPQEMGFEITLQFQNTYQVGDRLYVYVPYNNEQEGIYDVYKIKAEVVQIVTESNENSAFVQVDTSDPTLSGLDREELLKNLVGQVTFLMERGDEKIEMVRYSIRNIDLLEPSTYEEEEDIKQIRTRIGNLQELNKTINVQQTNSVGQANENITPDVTDNKQGIYSDKLITDKSEQFNANLYAPVFRGGPNLNLFPLYEDGLTLPVEDDSQIVVTSEWVKRLLRKILPPGTIVSWSGTAVPDGWALCDGTNGTPNLIDKFIKAGATAGQTGGRKEITLEIDNLPPHSHSLSGSATTSSNTHSHTISHDTYGYDNDGGSITTWTSGSAASESTNAHTHSHTVDMSGVTVGSVGNGEPINIEPQYYTLMYIMKLEY